MKRTALIVLLLSLIAIAFATIDEFYDFSATTATYVPITGTVISEIATDDALSPEITLGFNFSYCGTDFNSIKVSSNGWVGLGASATGSNLGNDIASTTLLPFIAVLWDDISMANGSVSYLMSGTAPNRTFTIQYENAKWNYGATNEFDFQVVLLENGSIYLNYGPSTGTPSSASASIGINATPGGTGWFYSVTPGTPSTASMTVAQNSVSAFPGNGVRLMFSAVAPSTTDLACISITGNFTPTANTASNYAVVVRNRGTQTQNTYSVKLIDTGGAELASLPGTAITAGQALTFQIPWTPTVQGPTTLRGKVVLTGDTNPNNDISAPIPVTIMPPGISVVTVGTGTEQALMPVDMYYRNSLYETLYFPAELGMVGTITALAFYNNFVTDLPNKPTKIWLGTTQNADLSGGWIPSTQLTLVYDGNVTYPTGQNTIMIPLQTPFTYTNGNLVMLVNRPMDTTYFNWQDYFLCQTVGTNRALRYSSDSTLIEPSAPPAATPIGQFPKTSFYMTPLSPDPIFMVNPTSVDYGQVLMNSNNVRTVRILNVGGGTLGINSISFAGNPAFSLTGIPTLPQNLTTGQSINLTLTYIPTAAGTHTGTITVIDNLTRQTHTIQVTATCLDPTIYALPYVQNWDSVTAPFLPIDWTKIVTTTSPTATVQTSTSTPQSAPNCVMMYNYDDSTSTELLVSPPIAPAVNLNTTRIKAWVKASESYHLFVGILTNPTDPATFTMVQDLTLTSSWTQYVIDLTNYTGTGRYVAFKHGGASLYQTIYIDGVSIEPIAPNDLAATSVSGNSTPSVNSAANYTVGIHNWGTASQSVYTVKLMSGTTELASTSGVTVAPGADVQIPISFTPTVEGPMVIYGKVVLAGDVNTTNDQSPTMNLSVMPAGMMVVTVGDGSTNAQVPVDMFWKNSLFETLYYPQEMTIFGNITALTFYNNFVTDLPNKPTKIWLGSTQSADLSAAWIPSTQLTLVYDGNVSYPSGQNTITIPLQTPFTYTGGNLVLMANRPMDTTYFSSSDVFLSQSIGTARSRKLQSDSTLFDPTAPQDGATVNGVFPKTTFHMTPLGVDPVFIINPTSHNYGTVLLNTTHTRQFTVTNAGGGPLTISSMNYTGSPLISITGAPTMPVTLATGQNFSFTATYLPTATGTHTGTITFNDNMATLRAGERSTNTRQVHTVDLTGICIDATITALPHLEAFDTVTAPALPVTWSTLVQSSGSTSIGTSANAPYSGTNCVVMTNTVDSAPTMLLISPPIQNATQMNTMRTKFFAAGTDGHMLQVGIMTNPQDPTSFVQMGTVTLTATWTEYVVSFTAYTGAGHYIAFRHGGGTYQSIRLDSVLFEITPNNDIAATAITGNPTPSVGSPAVYTVSVFNWGINPQTTYTVKLFRSPDIELASVAGVTVQPNQTASVPISWTPTAEGNVTIYAKTILTGDQNSLNDQSPNLNLIVQPQGLMLLTVGIGDQDARMPVDFYWKNSLFETMYYPAELSNTLGIIYGVSFTNNFTQGLTAMPTKIWLGTTTQPDLSAGWIPSTQLTLVFDGTVDYPSGENNIHIPFTTPYLYLNPQNLVMMVNRPMDTQYYSSTDYFKCQTVGENRSRNIYSDSTEFDPTAPADGTVTGQFPKTQFYIIPGGVGHVTGTVLGAGNQPLAGVSVQFANSTYAATTDAQGHFGIQNMITDDYSVSFSKYGYITHTQNVTIVEDETLTLNVTMTPMPVVNVTGTVIASDTGTGLSGAAIHLVGYQNYTVNTTATGAFTIPAVYASQAYTFSVICPGYTTHNGTANVGTTNYSMGTITLNEVAFAPNNVNAALNPGGTEVNLAWNPPNPNAIEVTEDFEAETFPPLEWTRVVTNNGTANSDGVYPTWCSFGTAVVNGNPVQPYEGLKQAGLWWSYEHQDEWLITPSFNCPPSAYINFGSYVYLGSTAGDHYYVKISTDNGNNWTVLWDASAQTGGWNQYASDITISLEQYGGQQVKIAWNAVDPPSNDGLWYVWFIDDVYIGNAVAGIRFDAGDLNKVTASRSTGSFHAAAPTLNRSRHMQNGDARTEPVLPSSQYIKDNGNNSRFLTGYRVFRLLAGQETSQNSWTELTTGVITMTTFTDPAWASLADNSYRWAVKAVYTAGVLSVPSFSNIITKVTETGMISGVVRQQNNQPIPGAVITAGSYTATTNNSGAYSIIAQTGTYSVHVSANNFQGQTAEGVVVHANQTTTVNFILIPGSDSDDPVAPVTATELVGNYPNPFNPSTTIRYSILEPSPVTLVIYNLKGQKVRVLVDQLRPTGHHTVVWDGKDDKGSPVSSGVYYYRMQAGDYHNVRKMLLME